MFQIIDLIWDLLNSTSWFICDMWTFVVAILDFGSHLGFYKDIRIWLGIQIFHINALGCKRQKILPISSFLHWI